MAQDKDKYKLVGCGELFGWLIRVLNGAIQED